MAAYDKNSYTSRSDICWCAFDGVAIHVNILVPHLMNTYNDQIPGSEEETCRWAITLHMLC